MLSHNNKINSNDHELAKVFINIIKKSCGEKPTNITKDYSFDNDKQAVDIVCNSYKIHPSILKIRSTITAKENSNGNTFHQEIVTKLSNVFRN